MCGFSRAAGRDKQISAAVRNYSGAVHKQHVAIDQLGSHFKVDGVVFRKAVGVVDCFSFFFAEHSVEPFADLFLVGARGKHGDICLFICIIVLENGMCEWIITDYFYRLVRYINVEFYHFSSYKPSSVFLSPPSAARLRRRLCRL